VPPQVREGAPAQQAHHPLAVRFKDAQLAVERPVPLAGLRQVRARRAVRSPRPHRLAAASAGQS
jgi:hypothetical protein